MTDVIFDIDGTLANPAHRLHFIKNMAYWESMKPGKLPGPNWKKFLSSEELAKDEPIPQTWNIMRALLNQGNRVLFMTGRSVETRDTTFYWLMDKKCLIRGPAVDILMSLGKINLFMRPMGDKRSSAEVKQDLLNQARAQGFYPSLAFEDRADDAAMWRRNGLLCCQVDEGNY